MHEDVDPRTGEAARCTRWRVTALVATAVATIGCSSPAEKLYAVGEKALAGGDAVKAMIAFNHARELRPDQYRYHAAVWRAHARFLAENYDRITVDNREESRFQLEQLLADAPHDATFLVAMAEVQEHSGERAEAGKKLDAAVQADPKSVLAHLARAGHIQRNSSKVDDAIAELQQVVALDPNNLPGHLGLGRLYASKKDTAKEVDALTKAVAIDPESYPANQSLGDAWLHAAQSAAAPDERVAKLTSAFKAYSKAAAIQPNNPEPHRGLGTIQSQAGKWAEAEHELRMAMRGQRYPEMDYQLGVAIARQPGRCGEAIPLFQLFLREQPQHAGALLELGACASTLSRKDEAVDYYKRILSLPLPAEGDPRRDEAMQRNRMVESKLAALAAR